MSNKPFTLGRKTRGGILLKYIKTILTILMIITFALYFLNIEKSNSTIFFMFLAALYNSIIFIEMNRENKKKDSIIYGFIAVMFWVNVFVRL